MSHEWTHGENDAENPFPLASLLFPSRGSAEGNVSVKKDKQHLAENRNAVAPQISENVPWLSAMSTFEDDPLILNGSYGYSSDDLNLCVVEPDKLLWQVGNIIHIFDVKRKQLTFRRSAFGQNIACICKAACKNLLAVCENGRTEEGCHPPSIIVYEWPGFVFKQWFQGGTARTFKSVDINSIGTHVAFVGDDAHRLTVRNFNERKTLVSDERAVIARVMFSPYEPYFFVTYGLRHLKFWLLNGSERGLTGAEASVDDMDWEITALSFLHDSRVITNMELGYLAVWESSGKLQCIVGLNSSGFVHVAPIFIRLYREENLLYTANQEGVVRVWNAKNVRNTKAGSPSFSCRVDPIFERTAQNTGCDPVKFKQLLPRQFAEHPFHFYAQDAQRGIWFLDLALKKKPDRWTCVNPCQTTLVLDVSSSPADYYLAVLSENLNIFCHKSQTLLASKELPEPGTCLLWLPMHMDPDGRRALVGFESGVLRLIAILVKMGEPLVDMDWVQSLRPHSSSVTFLTVQNNLIVSGSRDSTIFLYYFTDLRVVPVGYIQMPGPVCHIAWNQFRAGENVISVSCENGVVVEAVLSYEDLASVEIDDSSRDTFLLSVHKVETQAVSRSQSKKPRSYFSKYLAQNTIWIEEMSTTRRYHNIAYEVGGGPVAKLNISEGRVVHSYVDLHAGKLFVIGTDIGTLKVIRIGEFSDNETIVNGFVDSWESKMHRTNSSITKLCLSHDQKVLYSCGTDCAIFAYCVNLVADPEMDFMEMRSISQPYERVNQSIAPDVSLEMEKTAIRQRKETEARQLEVNKIKAKVLRFLENYYRLYELNKSLPKCLRVPELFFRLDTPEDRERKRIEAIKKRLDEITSPLEAVVTKLFESANNLNRKFVCQIKTSNFYLFAIRGPYYLKSFPEKRLFGVDPFGDDDSAFVEWKTRWGSTFDAQSQDDLTPFEQLVGNVVSLLTMENKQRKFSDSLNRLAKKNLVPTEVIDINEEEDHITSAGNFLIEHDKFTLREKHLFLKLDKIRVKRLRNSNELKCLRVVEKKLVHHMDLVRIALGNVLKLEKKNKERFPSVVERLVDLLNVRQLIYLKNETFNAKLKSLRKEKIQILHYDCWARKEVEYMMDDMKKWGVEFGVKMPEQEIAMVWDLECPEMDSKPLVGPVPESVAERLAMHKHEFEIIEYLNSIVDSESTDITPDISDIILQRREAFKNSMVIIKETIDEMITGFEERLFELLLSRKSVAEEVAQLRKEYKAIEAEVDILHRFKIMETKTFSYREAILVAKYYYSYRENVKRRRIKLLNECIKERQRAVDDINARFAAIVKDEKWAKHLSRTYRRKFKVLRASASEDSESSESESSSSDEDDGYDDLLTDEDSMSSATGVAYLYDETVIPPGCDEEKFRSMFQLRLLRHNEESKIVEFRKAREVMVRESSEFHRQALAADVFLSIFHTRSHRYKELMKYELGDVRSRMKLTKWTTSDDLEPGSLEDNFWIIRDDNKAHLATLKNLKESGHRSEAEVSLKIRNVRSRIANLEELENKNPLEGMEDILDAKWRTVEEAEQVLNEILVSMIRKGLYKCSREIEAKEKLAQRALEMKALLERKEIHRKKKRLHLKRVRALYAAEMENNRQLQKKLQDQKKGVAKNKYYHC